MFGRSDKKKNFGIGALKSGLYDASHHNAHNCFQKFCKFCAQEIEMIRSIFLKEGKYI
jgi:hypothetical protein